MIKYGILLNKNSSVHVPANEVAAELVPCARVGKGRKEERVEPRRIPQGRCTKQQTRLGMKIAVPYSPQPQASYYKSSKLKPKVQPPYQTIPKGN